MDSDGPPWAKARGNAEVDTDGPIWAKAREVEDIMTARPP